MPPGLDGALPKNGYSFSGPFSRLSDGACSISLFSSAYGGHRSNGAFSRCAYNGFLPGTSDMSLVENCVDGRGDCVVFPTRFSSGYVKSLRSGVCSTDGKKHESLLN